MMNKKEKNYEQDELKRWVKSYCTNRANHLEIEEKNNEITGDVSRPHIHVAALSSSTFQRCTRADMFPRAEVARPISYFAPHIHIHNTTYLFVVSWMFA